MDINQRPKLAILSGKDTWSTWSNGLIIYLYGKDAIKILIDPTPINPKTLKNGVLDALIAKWLWEEEGTKDEALFSDTKISSNWKKVAKSL
jgi:hypothetical protein